MSASPDARAPQRQEPAAPLRRTLGLLRHEGHRVLAPTLLSAATAASGVALLATSAWLIARASQRPSIVVLGVAVVGVRAFAISRGISRYGERVVGHDAALRALAGVRVRIYERLERLAPFGLPAFRRGDLLTRLVQDVDALQDLVVRVIPPVGAAALVAIPTVAVVWLILPGAGAVLGVSLLAGATIVPILVRHLSERREPRLASARGELQTDVLDLVAGAAELSVLGATAEQLDRVAAADTELTEIAKAGARTTGVGAGLIVALTGIAVWATLLVGVPAVRSGRLNSVLLAVIALVPLAAFEVIAGLPAAAQHLSAARRSAARVLEVMDAVAPVTEPATPAVVPPGSSHHLRLRAVSARYDASTGPALEGIDLDLPQGRRVGVVGTSGAGKSTLAAVLVRFLSYEGSVTLDGVELDAFAGDDVRRVVGLADQEAHIFNASLRENLLLARRDADDQALASALARVHLDGWLDELPCGLDTELGGRGPGLSGGQQRRIGIARCLLADFPVLILDEPGEHLDAATADALTADLTELTLGRTTVLITHRLAGLDAMDEILVLEGGRVVERGTHDELIAEEATYCRLVRSEREFGAETDTEVAVA